MPAGEDYENAGDIGVHTSGEPGAALSPELSDLVAQNAHLAPTLKCRLLQHQHTIDRLMAALHELATLADERLPDGPQGS